MISKRVFSSLTVEDVYESSIVQQCRMLESKLDTCVLAKCLSDTENAPDVVRSSKAVPISIYYYQPPLTVRHLQL